jgi:hypothetical protein
VLDFTHAAAHAGEGHQEGEIEQRRRPEPFDQGGDLFLLESLADIGVTSRRPFNRGGTSKAVIGHAH